MRSPKKSRTETLYELAAAISPDLIHESARVIEKMAFPFSALFHYQKYMAGLNGYPAMGTPLRWHEGMTFEEFLNQVYAKLD